MRKMITSTQLPISLLRVTTRLLDVRVKQEEEEDTIMKR